MVIVFVVSVAVTVFLLVAAIFVLIGGEDPTEARLAEVSATTQTPGGSLINTTPSTGLGQVAAQITALLNPIRGIITGADADLEWKLMLAGFRKPEHMEIFTAAKMLCPVLGIIVGSFFASNLIVALLIGGVLGFFGPDLVLSWLVTRHQENIRLALPDALDLLVVCMEAGLGMDQAMARVGDEMMMTAPALAEEFQIINREQRAGKPRLDAWRSMAARVDSDVVRQFVTMLIQTERFGTPVANALGIFADTLRERRTQAAEEAAAKTGVKLLLPLVVFIFPSIFVVSLGPAIIGLHKMFEDLMK